MSTKQIKKIIIWSLIGLLVLWSFALFFIDIEAFIESIGITNAYLSLFVIATITGTSFLTSASFYAMFVAYATSGVLDPYLMGLVGGIGMAIGDSMYFFISRKTIDVMELENNKVYQIIYKFVAKLPHWGVYLFTFLYASFAPIPNDILMITLGALKFKYSRIIPIIVVGNITLLTLIALCIFHIIR
jgi:membrane protein YqaA with SNARE-associated domain